MAKVTSKLQVTIPKTLAEAHGIRPGDEIRWEDDANEIRIVPLPESRPRWTLAERLALFDQATERQRRREEQGTSPPPVSPSDRGWTREELHRRGESH